MHPITKSKSIYTTKQGVNIYELAPTDFLNQKDGQFYYANFITWQQLQLGIKPLEVKAKITEIVNIGNSSQTPQTKVEKIALVAYSILLQNELSINKSLVLQCCSHFYYLDSHNPKEYDGEEVKDAIVNDKEAYDFFLRRLQPLLAQSLNISEKDTQVFMQEQEQALTSLKTVTMKLSESLKET